MNKNKDFSKAAKNICLHSLPEAEVWKAWEGLSFRDEMGAKRTFPAKEEIESGGEFVRLEFLNAYLF